MLFTEMDKILQPLRDRVAELEKQGGIEKEAERAREGSFFPLGIDGEEIDPDEYFADEADYTRRGIRRAYFAVQDQELRKKMIEALCKLESKHSELLDGDIGEKATEVSKAKAAVRRLPWGAGLCIALVCLAIGKYGSNGDTGTIVGAMFGLFIGLGYVWNSRGAAEAGLEQAEADLVNAQRDRRIRKLHPETFNAMEEATGEENDNFGGESARWKVREFLEKEPA